MTDKAPRTGRWIAATIALLVFASYTIETTLGEGTVLENAAGLLRFFTIWGNVAAAFAMGAIALGRTVPRGVMAAIATALTVIGLVYWGLLAGDHQPEGIGRITNQVFHTVTPIAFIGWWLAFTPRAHRILPLVPAIMVPPLSYGAFAFVLGELTGFYAYFFLDLPQLGWAQFLVNNAGLAVLFASLGAGLLGLKRLINRAL
ncbi:Pr6Pr family membrane protein [Erythrobacter sp. THAF29]|uniref:Pr6Pr family membrane protein n=1 Tax=Erythrobacter sp. THAF29 TaxID=2587851 RepID=UPI001267A28E|nr:Pr6Pr family membrane protein [Erythrobacter sp. THAF29]QFT78955.1 hypothetical protein FIU90_15510 [Erythrobacter sp. THAF29]